MSPIVPGGLRDRSLLRAVSRGLMALLVLSIITFATLEVLGRIIDPLGISYYSETARFLDRLILEDPIGYRLPPGMNERFWGTTVKVNSIGMRDREIPRKSQDEVRVMMLGDSVVFSLGVEYEDSIPYHLERLLNDTHTGSRRYRTLNMGVPSYNTEQELIQLKDGALELKPDIVLLMFVKNDIEPKMWVFQKRRSVTANLVQRSYAASLLYVLYRTIRSRLAFEIPLIQYSSFHEGNPRWKAIEDSLGQIQNILQRHGIPFIVVASGRDDEAHMRLLHEAAHRAGFRFAVLDHSRDTRWRADDPGRFVISATNNHCNPLGCAIIASLLYNILAQQGVLK